MRSSPTRELKVLLVINGLGTGGAERSLAESLPYLLDSGITPTIVCSYRRSQGVESDVRSLGVDLRLLTSRTMTARALELRRIIGSLQPDLIHTVLFESSILGRLAAIGMDMPVLTSLVNTSYVPIRWRDPNVRPWKLHIVRFVDSWTARHLTTHFHAITNAVKDAEVVGLGISAEKVTVIERGRDAGRLGETSPLRRQRARTNLGVFGDDPLVVSVGRHEFQKGQEYLIRAMADIADQRVLLLIAGRTGNATQGLQQLIHEMDLVDRVQLLGHREDVPELLAAADVFAFPSLYEGLGGALIEAMCMGLAIVATDLPVIREVTESGRCATLVAAGDVVSLAKAIEALLQNDQIRKRFGEAGRDIFMRRFTIERSADRLTELYRSLAEEGGLKEPV